MAKKYDFTPGPVIRRQPLIADPDKVLDAFEDDLNKKIPGIIEYAETFIAETQGENLRTAAKRAKPYVGKHDAAALQAGFELGQEWLRWQLFAHQIPKALEKKAGSDRGVQKALIARYKADKERRDEVMAEAMKILDQPTAAIVNKLKKHYLKDSPDDKEGFTERALEDLVREMKRKKKNGLGPAA